MKYSLLKRISAFVLAFALVMTTAFNAVGTTQANAAKKATVSAKGATVTVGASKSIKVSIKCKAKAKATIKVAVVKGATGKVTKKVTNSNAKKAAKTCKSTIKVTGKKAGKVKLSITPYINGKKAGKAKKITVTVKAKATTEAATTTAASADATTQATTELPALTSIEVAAGTKTLDIGGKTVVSAKSTTPGIEIASVSYSSDNSAAKVDANTGVVEGVAYGTAIITATAIDANGNKATASVAIEIKALDVTVELVSSADGAVTLAPAETKKFGVKVTPATWTMEYTSSNEKVATVSADGTITAVAAGTAVISATAQGTAKRAICNVTVVASSYGIAWATPNHANSVKVAFTTPIAKADQDKITIDLTYGGTKQDVTKKWAEDGSYVELVKATNFASGTNYSVAISGTSVSIDKNAASKTFEIKDPYEDKIIIASGQAFPIGDRIKVAYKVVDQYGDDVKTATPSKITWYLSSDNNRLSLGTKKIVEGNDTYGVAVIDTFGSFYNIDTKKDYNFTVSVRGTLTSKSSVSSYNDVTIKPVQLTTISLKAVNPNASGEAQPIYEKNELQKIPFTVNVKDENGQDWDPDVYRSYDTNLDSDSDNGLDDSDYENYYANNLDVRLSDLAGTINKATVEPEFVEKKFTGRYIIYIPADSYGKFSICLAANAKVTPSVATVEVLRKAVASKVIFDDKVASGKLGESVEIPVTFQDQYEKAWTGAAPEWTDFTVSSDDLDSASIKALNSKITCAAGTGKFAVNLSGLKFKDGISTGKFTLTCGSDSAKANNKTSLVTSKVVELTAGRTVNGLVAKSDNMTEKDGSYTVNIIGGQTETVTISAVDQYSTGIDVDGAAWAKVTGSVAAADGVTDEDVYDHATPTPNLVAQGKNHATILNAADVTDPDKAKWVGSKRTFVIAGANVSKTETETLSVQLYSDAACTKTIGKPISIKVNVNVKPNGFTVTPKSTEITAGTPLTVTIAAVDGQQNTVTTYSAKHELTITGSNGDSKTFNGDKAVKFENGIATVEIPTLTANDAVTYSTSIATADHPTNFTVYTSTTTVKIKPGDAKSASLVGAKSYDAIVLTLLDSGKNPIAAPAKKLNIVNAKVIDTTTKADVTKTYLDVDSSNTLTTIYTKKTGSDDLQVISLKADLVPGVEFTGTIEEYGIAVSINGAAYNAGTASLAGYDCDDTLAYNNALSTLSAITAADLAVTGVTYTKATSGTDDEKLAADKALAADAIKTKVLGLSYTGSTIVDVVTVTIPTFTATDDANGKTYAFNVTLKDSTTGAQVTINGVNATNGTLS